MELLKKWVKYTPHSSKSFPFTRFFNCVNEYSKSAISQLNNDDLKKKRKICLKTKTKTKKRVKEEGCGDQHKRAGDGLVVQDPSPVPRTHNPHGSSQNL